MFARSREYHRRRLDGCTTAKKGNEFDRFPIHLNFGKFIDSPTLSDVKLLPTIFTNKNINTNNNSNDDCGATSVNEAEASSQSLMSLDDFEMYHSDSTTTNGDGNDGSLLNGHWDILRSRCIVFDLIFHAYCNRKEFDENGNIWLIYPSILCKDNNSNNTNTNNGSGNDYGCVINKSQFPIIGIKTSDEALRLVINYIYTGVIRNRAFDDNIELAKETLELCDILQLPQLKFQLCGTFIHSRKKLRDVAQNNDSNIINNNNDNDNDNNNWKIDKSYFPYKSYHEWISGNEKGSFFNVKVLNNSNVVLYDPKQLQFEKRKRSQKQAQRQGKNIKNQEKQEKHDAKKNDDKKEESIEMDICIYDCRLESRQWIEFENGDLHCISKFLFYCLSKYFQALFDHNWIENQRPCVMKLRGIGSNQFSIITKFFYTGQSSLFHFESDKNILCLLKDSSNSDNETKEQEKDKEKEKEKEESKMTDEEKEEAKEKMKDLMLDQLFLYLDLCDFFMSDDMRTCILSMFECYININNLYKIWKFGLNHLNLQVSNQISIICQTYFQLNFERITCQNKEIFYKLDKIMIKQALSNGQIELNTNSMIQVLLDWVKHRNEEIEKKNREKNSEKEKSVDLCELLPPNTLFNRANKTYLLHNRRPMSLRHFLSLH